MRNKHKLVLTVLSIVLISGTLMFLSFESNNEIINIIRPESEHSGYDVNFDFDSFNSWSPGKTLQDFLTMSTEAQGMDTRNQLQYNYLEKGIRRSAEIITDQFVDPVFVVFDATHEPNVDPVFQLQYDLSTFGVELFIMWDEFSIPDGANALLLSASNLDYTFEEVDQIYNWFHSEGPHLLWIAGDSDYGGFYTPHSSNMLLETLGSNLRVSADAVADDFNNDGASYRVAAQSPACEGELSCIFTDGVGSAIFHGPTSIVGYSEGVVVDLNSDPLPGVEVVMRASSDAYALDQDLTESELDYYSSNGILGDYPMMAIQDMGGEKFIIASGEAIFSDYKNMYGMETEQGLNGIPEAWNGGFHEGKMLVDNVMTWWGVNRELAFDEPIYIFSNEDFVNYGFPGSGSPEDPFVIEGFSITNPNDNLINIFDTDAFFVIRDNNLNGFGGWSAGIYLGNVRNGIIESNWISGTGQAINLDNSFDNVIIGNFLDSNQAGINFWESRDNTIEGNEITNNEWAGISLTNELPMVWMRFNENITATERDSVVWQASFLDPDEGTVWYYHDNIEVSVTLDGEPVMVEIWDVYPDEEAGVWRFDMESWTEPLPLGEHVFETHFFLEGEEIGSGLGYVTVNPNTVVPLRFWQEATITDGDQIAWSASYVDASLEGLESFYPLSETILTINEELVEVTYTDIYFDEERGEYRFDMEYLTDPLGVGDYVFESHFIEDGVDVYTFFAFVSVLPVSVDDNNHIMSNYIANNGQGLWIDNSNANFIAWNTLEGNWGDGIGTSMSHRNLFTENTVQGNDGYGMNIGGDDNVITGNVVQWNGNGIGVYAGSNIVVMYNDIFQNWGFGLELIEVSNTFVTENTVHENGWGMNIASSQDSAIHLNEIFDNYGDGIQLHQNSQRISISDNMLVGNWGAGIWAFSETTAFLYFQDTIITTDLQNIWWSADSSSPDEGYLLYEHENMEVYLSIDGVHVEAEKSDLWFDEGEEVYRYEIFYQSAPLSLGDHVFDVRFFLDGEFDLEFAAFVTVVPGETTLSENSFTGNYIANNGWVGIGLDSMDTTVIDGNTVENNQGQGIWVGQSTLIEVTNNVVFSNWADAGINFYMTTDSLIAGNQVFDHWSNAILFEHSSNNQVLGNELYNNDVGIMFFESDGNLIQSNIIYWSWGDGIRLYSSPSNLVLDNTITESGSAGIWSFSETTVYFRFGEDVEVTDQQDLVWSASWLNEDEEFIQYRHDNLEIHLTVDGLPVDVEFSDVWFDDEQGKYGFDMNYYSAPLQVGSHEFEVQFVLDSEELLSAVAMVTVVPDESGIDESVFQGNYVAYNGWVGIGMENAVGGTIDSNTIEGNGAEGILLQASTQVEITDNEIFGNAIGVLLLGSSSNLIASNNIFENYGGGIGLLFGSNDNYVVGNVVHDLYGEDGIGGWESHSNVIEGNEIYNTDDAIIFRYSNDNVIAENDIHDNVRGIFLTTEPFEPILMRFYEDITVSDIDSIFWQATSVWDDFDYLQFEHDNMVVELIVDGELVALEITDIWFDEGENLFKYDMNYFSGPLELGEHFFTVRFMLEENIELEIPGIEFEITAVVTVVPSEATSSGNVMHKNKITDSEYIGIDLFGADDNVITKNVITDSGYSGIHLFGSDENEIIKNEIARSGVTAIELHNSDNNKIMKNAITEHSDTGIFLESSNGNNVRENDLDNNNWGIYLMFSHENDIARNKLKYNFAGLVLESSHDNFVSRNEIEENTYGLALIYSDHNFMERNIIKNNSVGVYLAFSYDNSFKKNEIKDNLEDFVVIE